VDVFRRELVWRTLGPAAASRRPPGEADRPDRMAHQHPPTVRTTAS